MRIISGIHKGKRLQAPKNLPVRPTTDFAKEGLFNILRNQYDLGSTDVLDLFAGTGNMSYEFGSRGTSYIVSVDAHYGCVKFIRQTAEQLELPIQTVKSDVVKFLSAIPETFDIIFADPPYDFSAETIAEMTAIIFERNLLKPEGVCIIEHAKHTDISQLDQWTEARKYGSSVFSFFR